MSEASLQLEDAGDGEGILVPGPGFVATAAFAVITLGATVTIVATFIALLIGGGDPARSLFALVAGTLSFATLALVQFIRWAAVLLRALRGRS